MVAATPRTQALANQICEMHDAGNSQRLISYACSCAKTYVALIVNEYRATGKVPRVDDAVQARFVERSGAPPISRGADQAKAYAEEMAAAEEEQERRRLAKLKAGRLGREVTDGCLQYWGGMGFMNETPVSRAYRDSRLASIGGGADEVMLMILSKMMGIAPEDPRKAK